MPEPLVKRVKSLIKQHPEKGFISVSDFVRQATMKELERGDMICLDSLVTDDCISRSKERSLGSISVSGSCGTMGVSGNTDPVVSSRTP